MRESSVVTTADDHGFHAMVGDKQLVRVTCLARSRYGERPWFAVRIACMNGDTYEVTASQRKSTVKITTKQKTQRGNA